jgi:hypothetical protein
MEDLIRAVYESLNVEKGGSTEKWWHDDGEFMELAEIWTLEGGRIRRIEEYFDRAEALDAVGLSE